MAVTSDALDDFIGLIAAVESSIDSVNFYAPDPNQILEKANEIRRRNLRLYLSEMAQYNPEVLLIGEAPGHLGCLLTGIPFTSEFLLLKAYYHEVKSFLHGPKIGAVTEQTEARVVPT